jgi:hypothetical protein
MQKTFRLLLVASAIILCALWFNHWSKVHTLNSGEVHLRPQPQDATARTTPSQPVSPSIDVAHPPQEIASNADGNSASLLGNQPQSGISALPASESLSRNGITTAGTGKFQLYRQGDITFRLNTETGQACVLFATDAQWRKPLVYDHGCASR